MAPARSNLTLAGLLYAGCDFEEWKTRADAMLCLEDGAQYTYAQAKARGPGSCFPLFQEQVIVSILCSKTIVSAEALLRIPECVKSFPCPLWQSLESQSKPFRLLDLPAELRNSIYRMAFNGQDHVIGPKNKHTRLHALLQVSKQIRQEALPLYWACTTLVSLRSSYVLRQASSTGHGVELRLASWLDTAAKSHMRHLRSFRFHLAGSTASARPGGLRARTKHLLFTFNKSNGLEVEVKMGKLAPVSLTRLEEHVARVERDRKIVDLQGECIFLALLSEPKLWNNGELEWVS